jgi:methionyl-tRNA synthetase
MQEFKFLEALAAIWGLIGFGDEYVNRTAPWGIKDSKEKTQTVFNLVVVLDNIAALLQPFLPETSRKITESINWGDESLTIRKSEALFPRLK